MSSPRRLILIGGGHSHIEVIRQAGLQSPPGVTLVSPEALTPYSGMLPGHIAGHYTHSQCHIDLPALCRKAGVDYVQDRVCTIVPGTADVTLDTGRRLPWDVLSIDIGSVQRLVVAGAAEHAVPMRPVSGLLRAWEAYLARAGTAAVADIVMVGGGGAGLEVMLAMHHRLRALDIALPQMTIVTDGELLPGHGRFAAVLMQRACARAGIRIFTHEPVTGVSQDAVMTGKRNITAGLILWATGPAAAPWVATTGLVTDRAGFLLVRDTLQSVTDARIFAAGDIATLEHAPRPKVGVYAVRQGPVLAMNLLRALRGEAPTTYHAQRRALALFATGGQHAVASYGPLAWSGEWIWRWKDRIDRGFMARYA